METERKKIKVLRIINRFNIGGPTYNVTYLTKYLSEDFETMLIGGLPEEGESDSLHTLNINGIQPLLIPEMIRTPNLKSDRKAYLKIKSIIKEFQPDIVHTHASKAGALGRRAAASMGVPIIVHTFHGHVFHSYFGTLKTFIFKWIERFLAWQSTGIIAISETQKHELSKEHKICHSKKIDVIPLGFDLNKFQENALANRVFTREKYKINSEEIAIAIIGRLAPIKNHTLFLNVLEKIAPQLTLPIRVFIVGDGEERENIERQISKIEKYPLVKIEMTSWIKQIDVFNPGMDIICLSSNNEGTPVSLIEAQASNVPVVSTDVGGVRDVVDDGITGYIVPKNDVDQYAEKLLDLINDEKKRLLMSQNGWNFVQEKFHYTTLVKNMENYYHKLLKDKRK